MAEKKSEDGQLSIECLPDEIIATILMSYDINVCQVLRFSQTCRYYYEMVRTNQVLWRKKAQSVIPNSSLLLIPSAECNWLNEIKYYYNLKRKIHIEVSGMSAKFYWREAPITPGDVNVFFTYALERPLSYYYSITILSELVKKCKLTYRPCRSFTSTVRLSRLYNMTNMYYAGIVNKYLIHLFLMVKWQQMISTGSAVPENVVNFFLQWIDTKYVYHEQQNQQLLDAVVAKVERLLPECELLRKVPASTRALWAFKPLQDNMWDMETSLRIHAAIKQVLYQDRPLILLTELDNNSLNLTQVILRNSGYVVTVATFYEAVARRFGLRCELVSFHDHFFLEWRESYSRVTPVFHVDLATGNIRAKRTCPFSNSASRTDYFYSPDSLVRNLHNCLSNSLGYNRVRFSLNASKLLLFLDMDAGGSSIEYKRYLAHLSNHTEVLKSLQPISLKHMQPVIANIIREILDLHMYWNTNERPRIVKKHHKDVKLAVGMICHHKVYNYVCIVRDWDVQCMASAEWQERMALQTLEFGSRQPFYSVLAVDHSERYVAQENLLHDPRLIGIAEIEEEISKEFAHFDGSFYIPNKEKESEYPEDGLIREQYRHPQTVQYEYED